MNFLSKVLLSTFLLGLSSSLLLGKESERSSPSFLNPTVVTASPTTVNPDSSIIVTTTVTTIGRTPPVDSPEPSIVATISEPEESSPLEPIQNPFVGKKTYYPPNQKGRFDLSLFAGLGMTNFEGKEIVGYGRNINLSTDFLLGMGYYVTSFFSLGFETGLSWSFLEKSSSSLIYLRDLREKSSFWDYMSDKWLASWGYEKGAGSVSYLNFEVPLRVYGKFNWGGDFFRYVSLQGFTGVDLSYLELQTRIYMPTASGAYSYASSRTQGLFVTNFTAGAKLSFFGVGIEYSYHLPIMDIWGLGDYFSARAHRLSVGFTANLAI